MPQTGFDLVVPDRSSPHDVEAPPQISGCSTQMQQEIIHDDVFCPCLPSYETFTFIICRTLDDLTDVFYEVLYGEDEENENEKDV